ncbi:ethanolamine utilization phosphate acetyltransferase EutD [Streptococcus ratti]|uniref:Phosphate propanoyltransferase n=1 Tax=Streptococcus ratti FA-1 = DSM 20564 TaxID=699248 RepID=A0ABP2QXF7_STRRT|nr:ethanolamine utilization phosphate acetyltransferase EutD [Streptococcus ratti]EJN93727.1 propanediol utilization protein PduL [Streptococcus ratti FA-1 = DSM 20564]EMP70634.1 propanediol utilization phosphotransacylase [Streptococcus ratti FA-1 = DSM 20564]QEY07583.1 phosphate propanoyltransferase [Streptococcus ratti]VEI60040.1 propanediol utilization protein PduL [Streptococcus mutans]
MDLSHMDAITNEVVARVKEQMLPSFEVEASGRHIHLSEKDLHTLLGEHAQLTPVKSLSQPGQFVSQVRLTVLGPKGALHNVAVLGPTRTETQVELSLTDAQNIGISAPIRLSGDIKGSPGITIINGGFAVTIDHGVIAARRHIHVKTADAKALGVTDREIVQVKIDAKRPLIFDDVVIRIDDNFCTMMHIDYDEANACGFKKGIRATIVR